MHSITTKESMKPLMVSPRRIPQSVSRTTLRNHIQRNLSGYLFLLPALLVFGFFVWYPLVLGILMSFQKVDLLNPPTWVGLNNYRRIFTDPYVGIAWANTFGFTVYALCFGYLVPLILGIALNEMRHLQGFLRLAFYIPVMLPPLVVTFLWRYLYNPDAGLLNALLQLLHLPAQPWLQSPVTALPSLVLVATWSAAGGTILIYLASLQSIPATLYEAAELDGANLWQRLWHITLPQIRGMMVLLLILQIIGTMQVFVEPFTLTGGGPGNATLSVLMLVYNYAFQNADFGSASALSVVLFLILLVFSTAYFRLTRRISTEG